MYFKFYLLIASLASILLLTCCTDTTHEALRFSRPSQNFPLLTDVPERPTSPTIEEIEEIRNQLKQRTQMTTGES